MSMTETVLPISPCYTMPASLELVRVWSELDRVRSDLVRV